MANNDGHGYLAAYKALGRWCPADMEVHDTAQEAFDFARKHHPNASAHDAVPFRPAEYIDFDRCAPGCGCDVYKDHYLCVAKCFVEIKGRECDREECDLAGLCIEQEVRSKA